MPSFYSTNNPDLDSTRESIHGTPLPPKFTSKRNRFVNEYLRDLNQAAAAVRAGYAAKSSSRMARKLMADPTVQVKISEGFARREKRMELSQDEVVRELMKVAFQDMGLFVTWDADGATLKPSDQLPEGSTAVVSEVVSTITEHGSNTRVKLHSKLEALNMLSRHLGMFVERVEHTGKVDIDTAIYQERSLEELEGMLKALDTGTVVEGGGSVE
jgi:phage terminase small subunit